jgi:hypothetical protein
VGQFRITARPATPRLAAALLAELDKAGVEVVISPPMPDEDDDRRGVIGSVADVAVSTLTFVVQAADSEIVRAAVRRVHHLFGDGEPDIEVVEEPDQE